MLDYAAIGKKIRQLRKARELSQEQLAERVWISATHMSHIETGVTKLSLPVLVDIANVLSASVDEILGTALSDKKNHATDDIQSLLDTCTPQQAQILKQILISSKDALDTYI